VIAVTAARKRQSLQSEPTATNVIVMVEPTIRASIGMNRRTNNARRNCQSKYQLAHHYITSFLTIALLAFLSFVNVRFLDS